MKDETIKDPAQIVGTVLALQMQTIKMVTTISAKIEAQHVFTVEALLRAGDEKAAVEYHRRMRAAEQAAAEVLEAAAKDLNAQIPIHDSSWRRLWKRFIR
jgi:hypothetical protein